jgi:cell wall-associated NlpC family hydrolase
MSVVSQVIAEGLAQIGKPYVYGQDDPRYGFDCSGLIEYVYGLVGIKLPHNAAAQQKLATPVASPLPGDLVFFGNPAYHVGLYLGNGEMLTAPHTGALVHKTPVTAGATFGRVPGSGAATSGVTDALATAGATAAGITFNTDSLFGQIEGTTLNVVVAVLGLGLVGAGIWLTTSQRGKKVLSDNGIEG